MTEFSNPNFSLDLSDQVALVTGASSGLGYRFAKVLAKCGAKVAISARRVEKLEELAKEIKDVLCQIVRLILTHMRILRTVIYCCCKCLCR